ncbi:MAG: fumarylacetoacetase [Planctomycetota bacterium]|nr:MAG: fumarylacetoacetase [Planctomycetota bacterium]
MKVGGYVVDASVRSWVEVEPESEFPIQNLPYGVFRRAGEASRVGTAIDGYVLDLAALHEAGLFEGTAVAERNVFARDCLNELMATGRNVWSEVRKRLVDLLADGGDPVLRDDAALRERALISMKTVELLLPVRIGDFTDFYSSKEHATNVGIMFRGRENALMPNWLYLPVGYHGRASTVFVSGHEVVRPCGQIKTDEAAAPVFAPSRLLDFELEMGFFVGTGNEPGEPIPIDEAEDHIFGMVLLNDWSARDIQKWEYQPLGPFLGKSFATTISPWVVTLDALEPFRAAGPPQDPPPLPYLRQSREGVFDIRLEAHIKSERMEAPVRITETNFKFLYWTPAQQLAHHASNGTSLRTGDLCGSGTISGPTKTSRGSMLELCWKGTEPLRLPDGSQRTFLADGDTLILRGWCAGNGYRVGFGECAGTVLPARA